MSKFKLSDTIELLTRQRRPQFDYERPLRLFELQVLTYAGNDRALRRDARRLVGTRLLIRLEKRLGHTSGSAAGLQKLLKNKGYQRLYDATFPVGHKALRNTRSQRELDKDITTVGKQKAVTSVCCMIDYRLRYMKGNGDKKLGTGSAGAYFALKKKPVGKKRAWKTTITNWNEYAKTAICLYVSATNGHVLKPAPVYKRSFTKRLAHRARQTEEWLEFFGKCAFVASVLRLPSSKNPYSGITPVPFEIAPLDQADLDLMRNYETEIGNLRTHGK